MRRRLVLLTALIALLPLAATASHATKRGWPRENVPVYDYTAAGLAGYVEIVVANWNAAAGGGITLNYVRRDQREGCPNVKPIDNAIVVCSYRRDAGFDQYPAGVTFLRYRPDGPNKGDILSAKVVLVADAWDTNGSDSGYWWHPMGCHEMGHALGLNHSYDNATTCMEVRRQVPGSHDAEALRKMYGGNGGWVFPPGEDCCGPVRRVPGF